MASLELSSDKGGSSLGSAGVSESKADICDGSGGGSSGGGSPADGFCDASASAEIDAAVDDSNDDVVGNGSASGGAAADAAVAQEFTASSGSGGRGGGDFEGGGLGAAGDDGPPMFPAVGDNHTPSKQIFLSHGQADSQDQCYGIALEIGPKDVWYDMTEEEITKPAMEKGIEESSAFVLFLNSKTVSSDWVKFELETAMSKKKKIVVVYETDVRFGAHPPKHDGSFDFEAIFTDEICGKEDCPCFKQLYDQIKAGEVKTTRFVRRQEGVEKRNGMIQEIMSKAERPVSFAQPDSDDESDKAAEERSPASGIGTAPGANVNLDFFFTMDRDKSVDQVDVLRWQLESRSFKVEVDYETRSEREGESPWPCEQFVEAADVVVVFLNSDSTLNCKNVVKSIEKGHELGKKFVVVHETDARHGAKFNVNGSFDFSGTKNNAQNDEIKNVIDHNESIEFKRRKAFMMVTLDEIIKKAKKEIPKGVLDSIRGGYIANPVVTKDGVTYDRESLEVWKLIKADHDGDEHTFQSELEEDSSKRERVCQFFLDKKRRFDSGNNNSVEKLNRFIKAIEPVQDYLSITFEKWSPPQVVVIGGQSDGKSTLLEMLTGLPIFPTLNKRCTKMPIRVKLRNGEKVLPLVTMHNTRTGTSGTEKEVPIKELNNTVKELMDEALKEERSSNNAQEEVAEGEVQICAEHILELELTGPDYPALDFLDLPGIVSSPAELAMQTEKLVEKWIRKESDRSVYLVVVPASLSDSSASLALKMIGNLDKELNLGERCVGVITKCDRCPARDQRDVETYVEAMIKGTLQGDNSKLITNGFVAVMCKPAFNHDRKNWEDCTAEIQQRKDYEMAWWLYEALRNPTIRSIVETKQNGCDKLLNQVAELYNKYVRKTWVPQTLKKFNEKQAELHHKYKNLGQPVKARDDDSEKELLRKLELEPLLDQEELEKEIASIARETFFDDPEGKVKCMFQKYIGKNFQELKVKLLETVTNSYKEPNGNGKKIDYVQWLEDYRGEDNTVVAATFYTSMNEAIGKACDNRDAFFRKEICECFNLTSLETSKPASLGGNQPHAQGEDKTKEEEQERKKKVASKAKLLRFEAFTTALCNHVFCPSNAISKGETGVHSEITFEGQTADGDPLSAQTTEELKKNIVTSIRLKFNDMLILGSPDHLEGDASSAWFGGTAGPRSVANMALQHLVQHTALQLRQLIKNKTFCQKVAKTVIDWTENCANDRNEIIKNMKLLDEQKGQFFTAVEINPEPGDEIWNEVEKDVALLEIDQLRKVVKNEVERNPLTSSGPSKDEDLLKLLNVTEALSSIKTPSHKNAYDDLESALEKLVSDRSDVNIATSPRSSLSGSIYRTFFGTSTSANNRADIMGFLKDLIVREPCSDDKAKRQADDVKAILEMRYERECEEFNVKFPSVTKQEWEEGEGPIRLFDKIQGLVKDHPMRRDETIKAEITRISTALGSNAESEEVVGRDAPIKIVIFQDDGREMRAAVLEVLKKRQNFSEHFKNWKYYKIRYDETSVEEEVLLHRIGKKKGNSGDSYEKRGGYQFVTESFLLDLDGQLALLQEKAKIMKEIDADVQTVTRVAKDCKLRAEYEGAATPRTGLQKKAEELLKRIHGTATLQKVNFQPPLEFYQLMNAGYTPEEAKEIWGCELLKDASVVAVAEHTSLIRKGSSGVLIFSSSSSSTKGGVMPGSQDGGMAVVSVGSGTSAAVRNCECLTDASVVAMAKHCPGLTSLVVRNCECLTDASVVAMAKHCPGLTSLDVSGCVNLTDTSVVAVAERCPGLKSLDVSGCDNLAVPDATKGHGKGAVARYYLHLAKASRPPEPPPLMEA